MVIMLCMMSTPVRIVVITVVVVLCVNVDIESTNMLVVAYLIWGSKMLVIFAKLSVDRTL